MNQTAPKPNALKRVVIAALTISVVVAGVLLIRSSSNADNDLLKSARQAIVRNDSYKAMRLLSQIPNDESSAGREAMFLRGELHFEAEFPVACENEFSRFLQLEESQPLCGIETRIKAAQRLSYLSGLQLRFANRKPHLHLLIKARKASSNDLLLFCFPQLLRLDPAEAITIIRRYIKNEPNEQSLIVGYARYLVREGRATEAIELLDSQPSDELNVHLIAAQMEALRHLGEWERMKTIHDSLFPPADSHPGLLLKMRGATALHFEQPDLAKECFELAMTIDSADPGACQGLIETARRQRDKQASKSYAGKLSLLNRLKATISLKAQTKGEQMQEILRLCDEAGLAKQHETITEWLENSGA